jgi:hypothetical protein
MVPKNIFIFNKLSKNRLKKLIQSMAAQVWPVLPCSCFYLHRARSLFPVAPVSFGEAAARDFFFNIISLNFILRTFF